MGMQLSAAHRGDFRGIVAIRGSNLPMRAGS